RLLNHRPTLARARLWIAIWAPRGRCETITIMQIACIAEPQVLREQRDTGRACWVIIPINLETGVVDIIVGCASALPRNFVIVEPAQPTCRLPSIAANRKQFVQGEAPAHS